ncbi:MAG: hypothetical protein VYA80_04145 [Pseudomonadota bacterium]|nr:hypothetical protein [Pseudomonadota bacterium]
MINVRNDGDITQTLYISHETLKKIIRELCGGLPPIPRTGLTN